MNFFARLVERVRATFTEDREAPPRQPSGDFRGRYGFGRRAHRTDPGAHYGFENPPDRPGKR